MAGLLGLLGVKPEHVAVERNRDLVPRARHAEATLDAGDDVEVVTLVGGGSVEAGTQATDPRRWSSARTGSGAGSWSGRGSTRPWN